MERNGKKKFVKIKKLLIMAAFGCTIACTVMPFTMQTAWAITDEQGENIADSLGYTDSSIYSYDKDYADNQDENNSNHSELIPIYVAYSNRFVRNSMIKDVGRAIGWNGIIRPLAWLAERAQGLYEKTLGLVDFTNWGSTTSSKDYDTDIYGNKITTGDQKTGRSMSSFLNSMNYIFVAILAVSLVYLGIVLIVDHEKRPKILTSIVLAAFCFSGLGWALEEVNALIPKLALNIVGETTSVADSAVQSNLYDLYAMEAQAGGLDNLTVADKKTDDYGIVGYSIQSCDIDTDTFRDLMETIDFTEVVAPDSEYLTTNANTVLSYHLTYTPSTMPNKYGTYTQVGSVVAINDGMKLLHDSQGNGMFNDYYYRYTINWLPAIITLIAVVVLFVCMAYKVIRLIIEIAIERILALLYSADLNGTQRTMRILRGIVDAYIVLLLSAVLIKVFYFAQAFLSSRLGENTFAYCILLLFATMAICDGPNLVQQLTGIDAGISSVAGRMMGGLYAANMAGHAAAGAVRGGVNAGRALGRAASGAAQGGGRAAQGAASGAAAGAAANDGKGQLNENGEKSEKKEPETGADMKKGGLGTAFGKTTTGNGSDIDEQGISPKDARDTENEKMNKDLGSGSYHKSDGGIWIPNTYNSKATHPTSNGNGAMQLNSDSSIKNSGPSAPSTSNSDTPHWLGDSAGLNNNANTETPSDGGNTGGTAPKSGGTDDLISNSNDDDGLY